MLDNGNRSSLRQGTSGSAVSESKEQFIQDLENKLSLSSRQKSPPKSSRQNAESNGNSRPQAINTKKNPEPKKEQPKPQEQGAFKRPSDQSPKQRQNKVPQVSSPQKSSSNQREQPIVQPEISVKPFNSQEKVDDSPDKKGSPTKIKQDEETKPLHMPLDQIKQINTDSATKIPAVNFESVAQTGNSQLFLLR